MRAGVLEVVWHAKEPVFSIDFHPDGTLVSAGADKEIRLWEVVPVDGKAPTVKPICSLANHQRSVNVVRFSPSGDALVSGGDHGELFLWAPAAEGKGGNTASAFGSGGGEGEERWRYRSTLRGHHSDVNDVSWSPDGTALVSGSVENIAMLWDISAGRSQATLSDHKHYVQGVAWSPLGNVLATQSADRTFRVYGLGGGSQSCLPSCAKRLRGVSLQSVGGRWRRPVPATAEPDSAVLPGGSGEGKSQAEQAQPAPTAAATEALLRDENAGFFKRLAWSPDGSFLAVPGGRLKSGEGSFTDATLIFKHGNWLQPALHLPFPGEATLAVRFCPVLFKLREGQPQAEGFDLPYSMVFAVATTSGVVIYSTQEFAPLALLGQLHYEQVTDLAWSPDGRTLACSSVDGYCSIAVFEEGELGEELPAADLPSHLKLNAGNPGLAAKAEAGGDTAAEASDRPAGAAAAVAAAVQAAADANAENDPGTGCVPSEHPKRRIAPEALTVSAPAEVGQEGNPQQPKRRIAPEPEPAELGSNKAGATPSRRRIAPTPVSASSPIAAAVVTMAASAPAAPTSSGEPKRRRITPTQCS